jgi:hypothetical protein
VPKKLSTLITTSVISNKFNFIGKRVVVEGTTSHKNILEEQNLKKRKLDLQIENLMLQNYKLKLEVLQLENSLNLPRSDFTQDIGL